MPSTSTTSSASAASFMADCSSARTLPQSIASGTLVSAFPRAASGDGSEPPGHGNEARSNVGHASRER
eukprot:CAMPEP_0182815876 /NCGR_PEP_ID=MMETSP0006_2-20121128/10620_1 /TAXON_ID=97485 /ORGANISM="Prymnesium parvum, Strain Texoma1" /LENGTH=67 /DNA_ID=CAMNT_0024942095 /DNA_START=609 /DNA_END=812 /DNA_ORIENTATION=-